MASTAGGGTSLLHGLAAPRRRRSRLGPGDRRDLPARPYVTFDDRVAKADGMAIDAEGGLWIAFWDAGEVRRYGPDRALDVVVGVPANQVTSSMSAARTCAICTSRRPRPGCRPRRSPSGRCRRPVPRPCPLSGCAAAPLHQLIDTRANCPSSAATLQMLPMKRNNRRDYRPDSVAARAPPTGAVGTGATWSSLGEERRRGNRSCSHGRSA